VQIELTGGEVVEAIDEWLKNHHGTYHKGPRAFRINGESIRRCEIIVDPSGSVEQRCRVWLGKGPPQTEEINASFLEALKKGGPGPAISAATEFTRNVLLEGVYWGSSADLLRAILSAKDPASHQSLRDILNKRQKEKDGFCSSFTSFYLKVPEDALACGNALIYHNGTLQEMDLSDRRPDGKPAVWDRPGDLELTDVTEVPPEDLPPRLTIEARKGLFVGRVSHRINENGLKMLSNKELETGLSELMGWTDIRWDEWDEDDKHYCGTRGFFNGCRQRLPNYVLGDTGEANFTAAKEALFKDVDDEARLLDALFQILGAACPVPRERLRLFNAGIKNCSMALLLMKRPELFKP
jgi:hypothetical protein